MKRYRTALLSSAGVFVMSILTILGLSAVTFATDGGGFAVSEWLVSLGFAAMWGAALSAILFIAVGVGSWIRHLAVRGSQPTDNILELGA